jgi:hypothetical protein
MSGMGSEVRAGGEVPSVEVEVKLDRLEVGRVGIGGTGGMSRKDRVREGPRECSLRR